MTTQRTRRACSWCPKIMDNLGPICVTDLVTHGICPDCLATQLESIAGIPAPPLRAPADTPEPPRGARFINVPGWLLLAVGLALWFAVGATIAVLLDAGK